MKKIIIIITSCFMISFATSYNYYIDTDSSTSGPGTNSNYSSPYCYLQQAVAAHAATPGAGDTIIFHCRGAKIDSQTVDIDGFNNTARIKIVVDQANRHAGVWNTGKYRIDVPNTYAMYIREDLVHIDGVQFGLHGTINTTNTLTWYFLSLSASCDFQVSNCIITGHTNASYTWTPFGTSIANLKMKMWNTLVYKFPATSGSYINFTDASSTASFYSCNIINTTSADAGIRRESGTLTMKNCYVSGGASGDYFGVGDNFTVTTCAGSGTGGNIDNVALNTSNFTNVTSGSEDFSLPLGSALIDVGTNTSGDAAPLNFTTDITGATRSGTWDVGAFEYGTGCTPATITCHATIIDTVGNVGRFGHATANSYDSINLIGTWPDSSVMLAKLTKDTVAYHWKKKAAKAGYQIRAYSCAGVNTADAYDTITVVGWTGTYTSPVVDTVGVAATHSPSSTVAADSFTFENLPSGATGSKTTGVISWTPSSAVSKTGIKIIGWYKQTKSDSTYDTISSTFGIVYADSVAPDTAQYLDEIKLYGRAFGNTQGASTITVGDSTPTVTSWTNTLIKFLLPNLDTGFVDFEVSDGVTADTVLNGLYVKQYIPKKSTKTTHGTYKYPAYRNGAYKNDAYKQKAYK